MMPDSSTPEEAALFNPAFMGLLVAASARDYEKTAQREMPFVLAFLVPPIALDSETRTRLPGAVSALLSTWVLANPLIQSGFADRAKAMAPLVREGLRYAIRSDAVRLTGEGIHCVIRRTKFQQGTEDTRDCLKAAAFAARWFARTGDTATIFALLGVRP